MSMMTVVAVMTMMAVTMATVLATGSRRRDRSRGQSESGCGSERNLAKHWCSPFQA
jgi:type II secretory pathway component PulK